MSNEQKAKNIADSHKPCTSEFYSGIYMGALIALNKEKYSKKDLTDLEKSQNTRATEESIINFKYVKFTEADIKDTDRLHQMIEKEAKGIASNPSSAKGRDYDTVYHFVRQGKIAELYLIENFGYKEADIKYHDLIDENGDYIEVKAYDIWDSNAPSVDRDLRRIRNEGWNKSKQYILFKYKHGQYEFLKSIKI